MHKVYVLLVEVDTYVQYVWVLKGRDREKKRGTVFNLCIKFAFGMSLSRQGSFRMHMGEGGGWKELGFVEEGFLLVLVVSGPEPECHIPLSG